MTLIEVASVERYANEHLETQKESDEVNGDGATGVD